MPLQETKSILLIRGISNSKDIAIQNVCIRQSLHHIVGWYVFAISDLCQSKKLAFHSEFASCFH